MNEAGYGATRRAVVLGAGAAGAAAVGVGLVAGCGSDGGGSGDGASEGLGPLWAARRRVASTRSRSQ